MLYDCQNGVTVSKTTCQCGCVLEPPNVNDKCATPCTPDAGAQDAGGDAASHDGGGKASDAGGGATPDASNDDSGTGAPQGGDASDGDGGTWGGSNGDTGSSGGCAIGNGGDASLYAFAAVALSLVAHRRRRRGRSVVREHSGT